MKSLAALVVSLALTLVASCAAASSGKSTCTVQGCVKRPGAIEVSGDQTAYDVVAAAGPIEGCCDLSSVRLVRQGPEGELVMSLNLEEIAQSGDSTFNVLVLPGDVLTVPER